MVKNDDKKALIKLLESCNVCYRCTLRFLGVRSYSTYSSKEEVKKVLSNFKDSGEFQKVPSVAVEDEHSPKRLRSLPCSLCLGILQDECDKIVTKIGTTVTESGFQFSDFVLQLSVPVVVDLRQVLMCLYIEEQLPDEAELKEGDIPSVKEVWKWIVGLQLGKILNMAFMHHSDFQISVSILYSDLIRECDDLLKACPEAFPNRKRRKAELESIYNRTSVMKAIESLSSKLKTLYNLPPEPPDKGCTYGDIICSHSPLYLAGRYNKYSRELSQTPWVVDGARRMESSVQEHITDIVKKWIKADNIIFSASGREDVDVKMLGNGRPFVLEVINPRRVHFSVEDIKDIENEINNSTDAISVSVLQVVSKSEIKRLKEGEEQKRKTYSALCCVKKVLSSTDLDILNGLADITLKQKTPIRVLHRRPLATRDRVIHKISGEILGPHTLKVYVETQAGTYIKEFVHSDFGRTVPSLGSLLGTEADILELDVESIDLDWPAAQTEAKQEDITDN